MILTYDDGVALVAGGSGGIGAAVVQVLAQAGVPVAFTYHRGEAAARRLAEALPLPARVVAYNWSGAGFDEAADLLRRVREELGPPRFVVHCSGLAQESAFHTLTESAVRELVETNLIGVLALTRAAITPMMKSGAGRVVFVGSVSGSRGFQGHSVYAATKAGLEGLTRVLAREAGTFGVTVNCVAPGFIDTPMTGAVPARVKERWLKQVPLGRAGRPEDVAALVAFVLSREAAYLTGQTLIVDGGLSA